MKPYVIRNESGTEFWSNEDGWVDLASATKFTPDEYKSLNLPIGGTWITLWEINAVQFARFIAECEACGVFSDEVRMEEVAESMDLELDEVYEIISNAQDDFSEMCKSI